MAETPEQVLERLNSDADAFRRRGHGATADLMAKIVEEFRVAMEPLALVPEHTAVARSGKSVRWLRERHATWVRIGAAGFDRAGNRMYRLHVLPSRLAREEGIADAERTLRAVG